MNNLLIADMGLCDYLNQGSGPTMDWSALGKGEEDKTKVLYYFVISWSCHDFDSEDDYTFYENGSHLQPLSPRLRPLLSDKISISGW